MVEKDEIELSFSEPIVRFVDDCRLAMAYTVQYKFGDRVKSSTQVDVWNYFQSYKISRKHNRPLLPEHRHIITTRDASKGASIIDRKQLLAMDAVDIMHGQLTDDHYNNIFNHGVYDNHGTTSSPSSHDNGGSGIGRGRNGSAINNSNKNSFSIIVCATEHREHRKHKNYAKNGVLSQQQPSVSMDIDDARDQDNKMDKYYTRLHVLRHISHSHSHSGDNNNSTPDGGDNILHHTHGMDSLKKIGQKKVPKDVVTIKLIISCLNDDSHSKRTNLTNRHETLYNDLANLRANNLSEHSVDEHKMNEHDINHPLHDKKHGRVLVAVSHRHGLISVFDIDIDGSLTSIWHYYMENSILCDVAWISYSTLVILTNKCDNLYIVSLNNNHHSHKLQHESKLDLHFLYHGVNNLKHQSIGSNSNNSNNHNNNNSKFGYSERHSQRTLALNDTLMTANGDINNVNKDIKTIEIDEEIMGQQQNGYENASLLVENDFGYFVPRLNHDIVYTWKLRDYGIDLTEGSGTGGDSVFNESETDQSEKSGVVGGSDHDKEVSQLMSQDEKKTKYLISDLNKKMLIVVVDNHFHCFLFDQ